VHLDIINFVIMAKKPKSKKRETKTTPEKNKFTQKLFESICNEIATSSKGLSSICLKHNISTISFYEWLKNSDELANIYARAREDQADFLADEMLEIAGNELKTEIEFIGDQGSSTTIQDNVQRSRLMIESRKWLAMKLKPKKYGDKLDIEMQNKIITVEIKDE